MTKKLQELFELPDEVQDTIHSSIDKADAELVTKEAYDNLQKIENALPQVEGLEAADTEMDDLAALATNSYKDLVDLGMQVDSRYASEIFNAASSMLGHAITAKTAKINKKLKMLDLQLKKAQLDQKLSSKVEEVENLPLGTGQKLDRNELLKLLAIKTTDK
jgi:hypothetical protein